MENHDKPISPWTRKTTVLKRRETIADSFRDDSVKVLVPLVHCGLGYVGSVLLNCETEIVTLA